MVDTSGGSGASGLGRAVPTVEGFTDLTLLGRGRFSSVYRATDVVLGRAVALKVLAFERIDDRSFRRECRILAGLSDVAGIVAVHQATRTADGRPVIVMRLYQGGSLAAMVTRMGPLSAEDVIEYACVLSAALGSAHRAGVYHRDIKPENVLFTSDGDPAIGDFGIAVSEELGGTSAALGSLSPPHAPPERFGEQNPGIAPAAGDIYSLGSTLYFALAGQAPFGTAADEGGLPDLVARVCGQPVPAIEQPDVGDDLNQVLRVAMEKDPADRFDSMDSLLGAVAACRRKNASRWTHPHSGLLGAEAEPLIPPPPVRMQSHWPGADDGEPESLTVVRGTASRAVADDRDIARSEISESDDPAAPGEDPSGGGTPRWRRPLALSAVVVVVLIGLFAWRTLVREPGVEQVVKAVAQTPAKTTTTSTTTTTTTSVPPTTTTTTTTTTPPTTTTTTLTQGVGVLSACEIAGIADLATPVSNDSYGTNYMHLRSGNSALGCTGVNGRSLGGVFDLDLVFDDLRINQGVGYGTGTIAWEDGTETQVQASAELRYPYIDFWMVADAGPFVGQSAVAEFEGWSVSTVGEGGPITSLHFAPTPMTVDPPDA